MKRLQWITGNKRRKRPEEWKQHQDFILELDRKGVKLDNIVEQLKARGFDVNKTQLHGWLKRWRGMRRGPYQTNSRPLAAQPPAKTSTLATPTAPSIASGVSALLPGRVPQTTQRTVAPFGGSLNPSVPAPPKPPPQSDPRDRSFDGSLPAAQYIALPDIELRSTRYSTTTDGVDHASSPFWDESFRCTDSSLTRPNTHTEGKSIRSVPSFEAMHEQPQAHVPGQSLVGTGEHFVTRELDSETVYVAKIPDDSNYISPSLGPAPDPDPPNPTWFCRDIMSSPESSMMLLDDGGNSQISRFLQDNNAGVRFYRSSNSGDELNSAAEAVSAAGLLADSEADVLSGFGSLSISESGSIGDRRDAFH